jgi:hypothetical protein
MATAGDTWRVEWGLDVVLGDPDRGLLGGDHRRCGAVWLVVRSRDRVVPHRPPAQRIVQERYARGELSTEEYCERLEHLR